jgi:hypothetical protein
LHCECADDEDYWGDGEDGGVNISNTRNKSNTRVHKLNIEPKNITMNAEMIINDDADSFCRGIDRYSTVNPQEEFKDDLERKILNYYENLDKLIFLYRVHSNINNLYEKHLVKCQHKKEPLKCDINKRYIKYTFFTQQEIRELNPAFEYTLLRPNVDSNLVKRNLVQLKDFPGAAKLYLHAMDKLNEERYERNILDDLRLCLESLIRDALKNNKSLENQLEDLLKLLKDKGTAKEVANMFRALVDYYSKYQNSYVKHNDNVRKNEIDLILNLTSSFISFIINI